MRTCSVLGCNADRSKGDLLFCPDCRKDWTELCLRTGIKDVPIPDSELNIILKTFQWRFQE